MPSPALRPAVLRPAVLRPAVLLPLLPGLPAAALFARAGQRPLRAATAAIGVALALAARLQQVGHMGDRVAILAPQGLDYIVSFFAAIQAGDPDALATFDQSYADLAEVLTPVLRTFGAEALVLGGSIAQSTELVDRFFTARLTAGPGGAPLPVSIAVDPVRSAIVGAAHWVHVRSAGAGGY